MEFENLWITQDPKTIKNKTAMMVPIPLWNESKVNLPYSF